MRANVIDLGLMAYQPCVKLQTEVLERVAAGDTESTLLFVEHDPVLTLGAAFHEDNLLLSREEYAERGIAVEPTGRGGDVTYHGPGQLVIYPVFDVSLLGKDLHKWMRGLEETMILTLASFGIEGRRFPPNTGAWAGDAKIAAIGVKVRKWVSMHGIALNCDNDLAPFDLIVPCGIEGYGVTSLTTVLGRDVTPNDAKPAVVRAFEQVFGLSIGPAGRI
jgi:lipoate-protein ligase B